MHGGNPSMATVTHGPPSNKKNVPSHAKDAGEETKTGQLGRARTTRNKDAMEWWITDQEEQEQEEQGNGIGDDGWTGGKHGSASSSSSQ